MHIERSAAPAVAGGAVALLLGSLASAQVRPHPGMLRYPDVSATHIVFVYANDLWLVPREGGMAVPLASPPGAELYPRFSADGEQIAFQGNYDGNRDLYVMPRAGGAPLRVTHHPSTETFCDWTPQGRLGFSTNGLAGLARQQQLFTVAAAGGLPERLPVPYGANGAVSPDGTWLAYTPHSIDNRTWKRYRGGMATDIWLFNLEDRSSRKITDWEGIDTLPMWHGQTVYYLTDAGPEHRLNIWSYDLATGARRQVTRFADYDVKWPSIGPGPAGKGEIVFQNGTDLHLLDLATGQSRVVEVTVPGDRPQIRPRRVEASKLTTSWRISPTGKRAAVAGRGDVWTLPAENGAPRNLTRTSGVAERDPAWSPDGKWIAYFSDATGEYELYVMQSDGKGEPRQVTSGSATFYHHPVWSPDSKRIAFTDKASQLHLVTVESGESVIVDKDPWGDTPEPSWSHDSRWIAYARTLEERPVHAVWLYEVETGAKHRVTEGAFGDHSPAFDRKGDWLYFASGRVFKPTYSDVDTTFIYQDTEVLLAVPLRGDVKDPWLPKSDEETWTADKKAGEDEKKDAEEKKDGAEEGAEGAAPADDAAAAAEGEAKPAPADDGVSGTWDGTISGGELPPGVTISMTIWLQPDGSVKGSITTPMGNATLEGTFDRAGGELTGIVTTSDGETGQLRARLAGTTMTGTVEIGGMVIDLSATRSAAAAPEEAKEGEKEADDTKAREKVEILLEGFERRAIQLPVPAGDFGSIAVNSSNQLIYVRQRPENASEIMLFDPADEKKEEKSVAKGAGDFDLSADGKKLLVLREGIGSIQGASAGATGKPVVTDGMIATVDPPSEWRQIFNEAWRLQRDYFYVANLHGVDWPAVRERYSTMLADCSNREDVSYVIREMISELNIGHAYYFGGDEESEPSVTVGMLGVDWELDGGAYRIAGICQGAPWDTDARSPLSAPGLDVKPGDYVLAVNGVPLDPSKDPWAGFLGLAGKTTTITVSEKPVLDDAAREVVVKPVASEGDLRYREWIERNRGYVAEKTSGRVGYIYVPDTGINGQNNLVRQYVGQIDRKALIIDERWNGGGQIPSRFIEMLNRPVTNYWARRDARDLPWPPDAHHGPKCMLINGMAGSGGDMFPWLFRHAGLGKLIGTRTWGGLVGISGNPGLIDGGVVTVPTFGFYETDGTWGVEGHGVDPDIVVLDDPAQMAAGEDPQLEAAIALMLEEIERRPYAPPARPAAPDRSGMGLPAADR
jgi:tricorn protease-like protein/C-terminal processing protease CtpA/Prc